jgi:hypothetical protein
VPPSERNLDDCRFRVDLVTAKARAYRQPHRGFFSIACTLWLSKFGPLMAKRVTGIQSSGVDGVTTRNHGPAQQGAVDGFSDFVQQVHPTAPVRQRGRQNRRFYFQSPDIHGLFPPDDGVIVGGRRQCKTYGFSPIDKGAVIGAGDRLECLFNLADDGHRILPEDYRSQNREIAQACRGISHQGRFVRSRSLRSQTPRSRPDDFACGLQNFSGRRRYGRSRRRLKRLVVGIFPIGPNHRQLLDTGADRIDGNFRPNPTIAQIL